MNIHEYMVNLNTYYKTKGCMIQNKMNSTKKKVLYYYIIKQI